MFAGFLACEDVATLALQHPMALDVAQWRGSPTEETMGQKLVLIASGALVVGTAGATAGELPNFERSGFPITQVQVSVLGSAGVQEQPSSPSLTLQGMPASPHQVAVLTHHLKASEDEGRSGLPMPSLHKVTAYRASDE